MDAAESHCSSCFTSSRALNVCASNTVSFLKFVLVDPGPEMVCHPERAETCAQQSGVAYGKLLTCLNDTDKIEGLRTFIDSVSQVILVICAIIRFI